MDTIHIDYYRSSFFVSSQKAERLQNEFQGAGFGRRGSVVQPCSFNSHLRRVQSNYSHGKHSILFWEYFSVLRLIVFNVSLLLPSPWL